MIENRICNEESLSFNDMVELYGYKETGEIFVEIIKTFLMENKIHLRPLLYLLAKEYNVSIRELNKCIYQADKHYSLLFTNYYVGFIDDKPYGRTKIIYHSTKILKKIMKKLSKDYSLEERITVMTDCLHNLRIINA